MRLDVFRQLKMSNK